MRAPRALTLEQIGERAGVSRSTVSRVLNDHPDVREEVRARVEAVIAETGYRPNSAARALVSSRTGLIGLVMLTDVDELFGDPYYSALVHGIRQACADHGLTFAIFPAVAPDDGADTLAPQITQGLVDGVVVTAGPRSDALIRELRDRGTPMVVIGHPTDDTGIWRVDVENRAGAAAAVAHLVEHGRRSIAYVGPPPELLYGVERLDGYRAGLVTAGLPIRDDLIRLVPPTAAGAEEGTHAVLDAGADAVFVATDPMAVGARRAIDTRGLRVPDDIALVGFDGLPGGPQLDPPLTTIIQPAGEVGRTAIELLESDEAEPRLVVLPTELRLGASCGTHDR